MANIISPDFPPRLHVTLTWFYAMLVFVLSGLYWWDYMKLSSLERFSDPVSAVADSIGPELEYFDGLTTLPDWQQRVLNFPSVDRAEYIDQVTRTWQELVAILHTDDYASTYSELRSAQLHLLVLLAEERGWPAAQSQLDAWQDVDQDTVAYLETLYAGKKVVEQPGYFPVDIDQTGWTALHLQRRVALATNDGVLLADIEKQIQSRNRRQVQRTFVYTIVWWLLMLTGITTLIAAYRRYVTPQTRYNIAWPGMDAVGVFVRAELLVTILLLLDSYLYFLHTPGLLIGSNISLYDAWPSLWRGLISVALVVFFLGHPRQVTLRDVFGLSLQRTGGVLRLCLWVIVLFSVDTLGTIFFNMVFDVLGYESPLVEGLSENLLWGTTVDVTLEGIDAVVWAPIFEEIVFRGVLYLGFRHWFSPVTAAFLSAMIFAFLHFYSLPGFIGVFWTGFVFALAFEYSRSLLPGIGAHMLTNLHWLLYSVVFYR